MLGSYKDGSTAVFPRMLPESLSREQLMNGHYSPIEELKDINENVKEHKSSLDNLQYDRETQRFRYSDVKHERSLICSESVANESEDSQSKGLQQASEEMDDQNDLVIDFDANQNQNNNNKMGLPKPPILSAASLANSNSMVGIPTMVLPHSAMRKESPSATPPSAGQKLTKKGTVPVREAVDPAKYVRLQDVDGVRYACSKCGNVYKWRKSLNKHWKEKHDGEVPVPASGNFPVLNIPHLKSGGTPYGTPKSSTPSSSGRSMISPSMMTPMGPISSTHLDKYVVDMGTKGPGVPVQLSYPKSSPGPSPQFNSSSMSKRMMASEHEKFTSLFPHFDIPFSSPGSLPFPMMHQGMRLKTDIAPAPIVSTPSQIAFPGMEKFMPKFPMKGGLSAHMMNTPPAAHAHSSLKHEIMEEEDSNSDCMPLDLSKKGKDSKSDSFSSNTSGSSKSVFPNDAPLDFSTKPNSKPDRLTPVSHLNDEYKNSSGVWSRRTSTPDSEDLSTLQCYKCPYVAKDRYALKDHMDLHNKSEYHQCAQCKEQFRSNDDLTRHFAMNHHRVLRNYNIEEEDLRDSNRSPYSGPGQLYQYLTKPKDTTHEKRCLVCGSTFPLINDLAKHFKYFHRELPNPYKKRQNEESPINQPLRKVPKLDDKFSSSDGKAGSAEGELECEQCAFVARDAAEMSRHQLVHSFNRPHACTMCGFSSKSKEELTSHIWKYHPSHAEELALMETNGGANSLTASKNLSMNTDKSPIENNTADNSGSSVSSEFGVDDVIIVTPNTTEVPLVRGRKSGKSGGNSSAEMLLPYKCSVCEYRARWPSEITQHMKNHSDEKPFHCPRCTYKSKWKWDVVKHLKRCGGGTVKDVIDTSLTPRPSEERDSKSPMNQVMPKQLQFVNLSPKPGYLSNGPPNVTVLPGSNHSRAFSQERSSSGKYSPAPNDYSRNVPSPCNSTSSDQSSARNAPSPSGSNTSKSSRSMTNQGLIHCTQCPFVGMSPAELKRHCRVHSDEKPFSCASCSYSSKWKCDLKKHCKTYNHVAAPRSSELEMKQKKESLKFMSIATTEDDLSSFSEDDVEDNSSVDQPADSQQETNEASKPTLYKCEKCQYVTYKKNMLDGHMKIHRQSGEKSGKLKCKQCDFEAKDLPSFLQHKLTHSTQSAADNQDAVQKSTTPPPMSIGLFDKDASPSRNRRKPMKYINCPKCPYATANSNNMEIHEMMHLPRESETNACVFCDYNVKNKALLKRHMKSHDGYHDWVVQTGRQFEHGKIRDEDIDLEEAEYEESLSDDEAETTSGNHNNTSHAETYQELGFQCNKCSYKADSITKLTHHMEQHDSALKYKCMVCSWSSNILHVLYKHLKDVHPDQLVLLGKSFKSESFLRSDSIQGASESRRTSRKKTGKPRTCSECGYMTDNPTKMLQHIVKHEQNTIDSNHCHYCDASVTSAEEMQEHLLGIHNIEAKGMDSGLNLTKSMNRDSFAMEVHDNEGSETSVKACPNCSFKTTRLQVYSEHLKQHGSKQEFTCDYCDFSVVQLAEILYHMGTCHSEDMDIVASRADEATQDQSDFKTKSNNSSLVYNPHSNGSKSCEKIKPINLTQVSKNNRSKRLPKRTRPFQKYNKKAWLRSIFRKSRSNQLNSKKSMCKKCSYVATKPFLMKRHMQFHNGLSKMADKIFNRDCTMSETESNSDKPGHIYGTKVILSTSTTSSETSEYKGRKAYNCRECPFTSDVQKSYDNHVRLHGVQGKYSCNHCTYAVNILFHLQQHMRLHENRTSVAESSSNVCRWKCKKCPYHISDLNLLKRHFEMHQKNFNGLFCPYCDFTSSSSALVTAHLQLHFPENGPAANSTGAMRMTEKGPLGLNFNNNNTTIKSMIA